MKTDVRIQVYFQREDYKALKERAISEGLSVAEVIRRSAHKYLRTSAAAALQEGYSSLMQGAGLCQDKSGDVSSEHDKYLGRPW
jgi:hypothetical protein